MLKKILFAIFVLALAGGAGYYIYKDITKSKTDFVVEEVCGTDCDKSETENVAATATTTKTGSAVAVPNLDRLIKNYANINDDSFLVAEKKMSGIIGALKNDPGLFSYWLDLGSYRRMIGDYEGAREAWEYVNTIRPLNSISFNNLGDLYAYYLKDNKKAEENFLTAVKNGPEQVYIYRNLYDFYRNVLKDDTKAKAILEKGVAANPDSSQDLKYLLDNF